MSPPRNIHTGPTIRDFGIHAKYWAKNWARMGWMAMKHGPFDMLGELRRYPWLKSLMKVNQLLSVMVQNRTGLYREANAVLISALLEDIITMVEGLYYRLDETVLHEDLVPPEIFLGMGLNPWMAELLGIVLPMVDTAVPEHYIDVIENEGLPPDICSLPKHVMGMTLEGHMPQPRAIVTSNMPCDGGMASYSLIERQLKAPIFRLDIPYNFYDDRAIDYFVGEMKRLIPWLEEHTPGRMDWDRMKELCEERNRAVEIELELWDLIREKPAPMAAEPVYLSHLLYSYAYPCNPRGTRLFQQILDLAKKIKANGGSALPDERFRVVLWNPPTMIFPDLFVWAEKAYGAAMIMDMLSYNRYPLIDTSSPDTILRSLAKIIMQGPMARHTRGPSENFFGDLFHLYEHFSLDMIWMAAHIGCKNTQALMGMFREKCRERDIPLLVIDYDLSDTRIVPPEGIKKQVDQFMETVMKAERLDT